MTLLISISIIYLICYLTYIFTAHAVKDEPTHKCEFCSNEATHKGYYLPDEEGNMDNALSCATCIPPLSKEDEDDRMSWEQDRQETMQLAYEKEQQDAYEQEQILSYKKI